MCCDLVEDVCVMMRFGLIASSVALISVLGVASASADDSVRPIDWSGLYVGGNVGGAWSDADLFFPFGAGGTDLTIDSSGVVGGLHAGYQHQWGSTVFGFEASVSETSLDGSGTKPISAVSCRVGIVVCRVTNVEWLTTAGLRLGYASGKWLLTLSGGYAGAEVATDGVIVATGLPNYADSVWHDGWSGGVGAEYAMTSNWSLGLDYLHVGLGEQRHADSFGAGNRRDVELDIDAVRVRVSYRFEP
jgi:outer membrane immunogenic protein